MKKQSVAIIGVIAFVLAVAVGYALFSDTITINGTATAKGDFDVNITSATYEKHAGVNEDTLEATITDDNLAINVDLLYPGAYAEIDVVVTNEGSIPAILKSIEESGLLRGDVQAEDSPVIVTYPKLTALKDSQLNPEGIHEFTIRVEWDSEDESNSQNETVNFNVKLNYEQVTVQ